MAGYDVTVKVSEADENVGVSDPAALVEALSRIKAEAVTADGVLVAADTVVALDGEVLGKPKDADDARRMLRELSGREHSVFTGFTVKNAEKCITEHVETRVVFRHIAEDELEMYVSSGEPLDKAGAYGIQGIGGMFVSAIAGDYYTVVGLPLCRISEILRMEFDITPIIK